MTPLAVVPTLVVLAVLAASAGCRDSGPPQPDPERRGQTGVLDPAGAAVGDTLLGLRILTMDVSPAVGEPGGWYGRVEFEGEVTLSGEFRPHPADPEVDDLCFFPDAASAVRLPRLAGDQRTSWLCFTDSPRAGQALGTDLAGAATVSVDRFLYHFAPSDVYNRARLLRVEPAR